MAAPLILPDQSAPRFFTYVNRGFRPAVMNSPTSFTTAGTFLPPGLTLDTATGLISGAPSLAGTYFFALQAENSDGLSTAELFALEVVLAPPQPPASFFAVEIEMSDGAVTFPNGTPQWKSGDNLLQQIQLKKYGVVQDLDVTSVKFNVKFSERDGVLLPGGSSGREGTGEATVYRHATALTGAALEAALGFGVQKVPVKQLAGTEMAKRLTQILALGEYEFKLANTTGVGPSTVTWTSQTVAVEIVRELIPNA